MTPIDIATDVESLGPIGTGDVNWSTSATYCYSGGTPNVADDQRTWD